MSGTEQLIIGLMSDFLLFIVNILNVVIQVNKKAKKQAMIFSFFGLVNSNQ